jgi:hypothetical protein
MQAAAATTVSNADECSVAAAWLPSLLLLQVLHP